MNVRPDLVCWMVTDINDDFVIAWLLRLSDPLMLELLKIVILCEKMDGGRAQETLLRAHQARICCGRRKQKGRAKSARPLIYRPLT